MPEILKTSSLIKLAILQLGISVLFMSCGGDADDDDDDMINPDPEIPAELSAVTNVFAGDIANDAMASDIQVYFSRSATNQFVSENRVIVVKSESTGSFDLAAANAITSSYAAISELDESIVLSKDLKDSDGDDIVEGQPYGIFVLSVSNDASISNALSTSAGITLEQKSAVRNLTDFINAGSGGMDSDDEGNIYMADFGASLSGPPGTRVFLITPEGDVSTFANGLVGASGNEFDSEGNLFQSNIGASTVSKITTEGEVSTFVSATLSNPVGITFDPSGDMYVANCGGNRISRVSPEGQASIFASSSLFNCPNGITIDNDGNLYVANFGDGGIIKITPEAEVSQLATVSGGNNGHLLFHNDLLWVVGRRANRIYTVTLDGEVKAFAGSGSRGNRNGSLDQAQFSLPNDLTFSPDGRFIYVNDVDVDATGNVISPTIVRVIELVE